MTASLLRAGPLSRLTTIAAALIVALGVFTAVSTTPASAAVTLYDVELEYGKSGNCVERLQKRLNALGLNCGNQLAAADEDDALIIARCESAYNPLAIGINTNGTMDIGVFQLNTGGTLQAYMSGSTLAEQVENAFHSDTNIHAAHKLQQDEGDWGAWSCRDHLPNG